MRTVFTSRPTRTRGAVTASDGAQIYAFSKAQLAAGAASVTMVHIDTTGMVNAPSDAGATQPGFTVWPAQSPGNQFDTDKRAAPSIS